jgi:hypothetical protein
MVDETLRQTGRTSRIVDFAIDQLFTVGSTIVTDHTALEGHDIKTATDSIISSVNDRFLLNNKVKNHKLVHRKIKVENITMIRFDVVPIVSHEQ